MFKMRLIRMMGSFYRGAHFYGVYGALFSTLSRSVVLFFVGDG